MKFKEILKSCLSMSKGLILESAIYITEVTVNLDCQLGGIMIHLRDTILDIVIRMCSERIK